MFAPLNAQHMFSEPKIISTSDLKKRSYLSFHYNGKRYREYNANRLGLKIFPNHVKSVLERDRLLIQLHFEYKKALNSGWSPLFVVSSKEVTLIDALTEILNEKLSCAYSETYKRDLKKIYDQFIAFVPSSILTTFAVSIELSIIDKFLAQFNSSSRHYMNKRRGLSVFFSVMVRKGYLEKNIILSSGTQKCKSSLHEIYTREELNNILDYLKLHYSNLHLCCLLTYGCFLRPHKEIRLLSRSHFNEDFTKIVMSGDENKSGRIRNVFIPKYVKDTLQERFIDTNEFNPNVFTLKGNQQFNADYFKTQWSRAKVELLKLGLINSKQTLYSFRHTAAVNVYRKTKDLQILQQLLQHSNMIVTLNYLRGLGEINDERLRDVLPEL